MIKKNDMTSLVASIILFVGYFAECWFGGLYRRNLSQSLVVRSRNLMCVKDENQLCRSEVVAIRRS